MAVPSEHMTCFMADYNIFGGYSQERDDGRKDDTMIVRSCVFPAVSLWGGWKRVRSSILEECTLTRVMLERRHGSVWGVQFYVDVCPREVTLIRYFPREDPGGELAVDKHIPLTSQRWDEIVEAVAQLRPQLSPVPKPTFWARLTQARKGRYRVLDGVGYHHLALTWQAEGHPHEVRYDWPGSEQAKTLETLLERLTDIIDAGR